MIFNIEDNFIKLELFNENSTDSFNCNNIIANWPSVEFVGKNYS